MPTPPSSSGLQKAIDVVAALRDPETGCPWDLKQTHHSLRPFLLEEAYEAVETMQEQSPDLPHLKEELGDVLLQVLLHAQIAEDNGHFSIDDLAEALADKLIHRHPHVFEQTNTAIDSPEAVTQQWEQIKQQEKPTKQSVVAGVSQGLPALMRAQKNQ